MLAKTWTQALCLGMTREDGIWDYRRGYVTFPKHESDLPGNIFDAFEIASSQRVVHVLEEAIQHEAITNLAGEAPTFQNKVSEAFPPGVMLPVLDKREISLSFAQSEMNEISSSFETHFAISPDPTRFEQVQPENCTDSHEWKEAIDEDMKSMDRFKVFTRVPISKARGRQILGCKWYSNEN
jgi:hypothetical protein